MIPIITKKLTLIGKVKESSIKKTTSKLFKKGDNLPHYGLVYFLVQIICNERLINYFVFDSIQSKVYDESSATIVCKVCKEISIIVLTVGSDGKEALLCSADFDI